MTPVENAADQSNVAILAALCLVQEIKLVQEKHDMLKKV